jgi:predicted metalloprotease with PDZ domain
MASAEQVRYGYAGGVTACMALDEMLAQSSGRTRPLDEVVRRLYTESRGQSLTRERLESTIVAVTGVDCGAWLDTYVYGKTTLPAIRSML